MSKHVLIVDDEDDIRFLLQGLLEDEKYQTSVAASAKVAREKIAEQRYDAVILDVWLQNGSDEGLQLLSEMLEKDPFVPVIMISGHSTIETAVSAIKKGAYDFLEKPFKSERLLTMVKRAIEYKKLNAENKNLRATSQDDVSFTGESSALAQVKETALRSAETNSRIMIFGADGSGKKTLARYIHKHSHLKDNPLKILTCQDYDADVMLADLNKALLATAQGTLVLNHVEKLPDTSQERLLHVLQSKKIEGQPCDARVISLTTQAIERHVNEGLFKSDLFYRLNVVPLTIPDLKERSDDIENIIDEIFETVSSETDKLSSKLSSSAIVKIKNYEWPGNVRQLKNFIEWMYLTGLTQTEDKISAEAVSDYIDSQRNEDSEKAGQMHFLQQVMELPLREARELFETLYLKSQITRFDGNVSKTSEFVGMERSALHRKIKSLNIHKSSEDEQEGLDNVEEFSALEQNYEDLVADIAQNTGKKRG